MALLAADLTSTSLNTLEKEKSVYYHSQLIVQKTHLDGSQGFESPRIGYVLPGIVNYRMDFAAFVRFIGNSRTCFSSMSSSNLSISRGSCSSYSSSATPFPLVYITGVVLSASASLRDLVPSAHCCYSVPQSGTVIAIVPFLVAFITFHLG